MARTAEIFGQMAPINDVLSNNAPNGFLYDVVYIPGAAQYNTLRNRSENEAALAQSQEEHNDLLNKYINLLQYPPEVRRMMGQQMERNTPKWNPNEDRKPRRPLTPSSSVVSEIKITPENTISIKYGPNSKSYTFRGGNSVQEAAQEVLKLINSPSLDKELSKNGSWARTHRI